MAIHVTILAFNRNIELILSNPAVSQNLLAYTTEKLIHICIKTCNE